MASPPDDHSRSNPSSSIHQRILSQFQGDWVNRLNVDQMFILIDGILPFEVCLYYQVLPLFVEGNRLNLGMVSPEDTAASEYIRRIVSYLNYSLFPRSISSEALRVALTAYLNHTGKQQPATLEPSQAFSYGHHRHNARSRVEQQIEQSDRQTLVVDSPEELGIRDDHTSKPNPVTSSPASSSHLSLPVPSSPHQTVSPDQATLRQEFNTQLQVSEQSITELQPDSLWTDLTRRDPTKTASPVPDSAPVLDSDSGRSPDDPSFLLQPLPTLQIQANYLSRPVDVLATLPAEEMLQELMSRVLVGGIGRLFFERHSQYGRVLWSQNGVLQSVLERLSPSLFQGLVNALKQMAQMSLITVSKPEQVEIEYLYDRTRILLRFRFMPNGQGEDATLQVLRGAALKFYERQQVTRLERDALSIAKQLQNKLNEIRDRAHSEPGLPVAKSEVLPALGQLLQNIEDQLDNLGIGKSPENLSEKSPENQQD